MPVATVRHYLREGLLPEPVKTSRNMAYYPPEFVERIRLIKQLQEERFMPLRVIRDLLDADDGDPERLRAVVELGDRDPRPGARPASATRTSAARGLRALRDPRAGPRAARGARRPEPERARLLALGHADHRGDRALSRRRLDETIGFGARYDTRAEKGLEPVVAEELGLLIERFAGAGARARRSRSSRPAPGRSPT